MLAFVLACASPDASDLVSASEQGLGVSVNLPAEPDPDQEILAQRFPVTFTLEADRAIHLLARDRSDGIAEVGPVVFEDPIGNTTLTPAEPSYDGAIYVVAFVLDGVAPQPGAYNLPATWDVSVCTNATCTTYGPPAVFEIPVDVTILE